VFRGLSDYAHAAPLALTLTALMQFLGEETDVDTFLAQAADSSCSALTDAVTAAESANSHCPAEWTRTFGVPMMSWAAVALAVSGASRNGCLVLNYDNVGYYNAVAAHKETAIIQLQDRAPPDGISREDFVLCQCNNLHQSEWTPEMSIQCPMKGSSGLPEAPATPTDFGVAADALLYVTADEMQLGEIDLPSDETNEKADFGYPLENELLPWAYANCLDSGNAADLGRLLLRAPDNTAASADAQHCGSMLTIQATDAAGGSISKLTLNPPQTPSANAPSAAARLTQDGSVTLAGPIAALHCVTSDESSETIENDTLLVTVVGASGETTVHMEMPDGDGTLLSTPLNLPTTTLEQASGVSPGGTIEVHVSRQSPGCDGLYGAAGDVTRLFTLTFSTPSPNCQCAAGSVCRNGTCCRLPFTPCGGGETGSLCGLRDDGCGGTIDCGPCPKAGACKRNFSKDQCIVTGAMGEVTLQRCGPVGDGCGSAGVPEYIDCGECPDGQYCDTGSSQCARCPDCSLSSSISLNCGFNVSVCGPIMCSEC
jgi:hypothetical protein